MYIKFQNFLSLKTVMHIYLHIKSNNQIKESFVAKHNGGPCLVISQKDTHDNWCTSEFTL